MDDIAIFAAGYATAVVAGALGLDWVGEATARRRPGATPGEQSPIWPHSDSIAIHTVVAMVAALAGLLVLVAIAVGHHSAPDLLVLVVPSAFAVGVLQRLGSRVHRMR